MQKRTRITVAAIAIPAAAAGLWFYGRAEASEAPAYRVATVERSDLRSTVSATGNLSAVTTVQVGTQVSGQISAIYADFNDEVKKGQLLARIDPVLQEQAVREAQAGLQRARAQYDAAKSEYDRNVQLYAEKIVTASEFGTVESTWEVARANLTSAQIALDRARQNLGYTSIYSPIDGVIVERNVDVGQTVAASLSAPQLFLIANDLSAMQILASVDESDIGSIAEGQPVTFTVQSYADQRFSGTVKQVRLQSTTTENVVNYTVVVAVDNPEGALLPGMTATVDFVTGSAADVLTVPNAALRFRPATATATRTAAGSGAAQGAARGVTRAARGEGTATTATIYTLDASGAPRAIRVRTGLSDGQRTAVEGEGLDAGMSVVTGASATASAESSASGANPFQQQSGGPRPPGSF